ncbi:MAG: hypothetical protein AAF249_16185 [Pseudomonadota bacterium]
MIFEVTPDEIAALNDSDLRSLIGKLAEQEAVKHGGSSAGVTYGGHQNAKDGGIDVRADLDVASEKSFIPRAATGYQVKAEDFAKTKIISEMRPNGKLRTSIKELAEQDGAYIIVSSKGSVSDTALKNRRKAMREALKGCKSASKLKTDFFDRQRVATWVNQIPGIIPWVKERVGHPLSGWQAFGDWSSSPSKTDDEYLLDEQVRLSGPGLGEAGTLDIENGVNNLREILNAPKGAIRLVGLSGVGKTRLVQALFDERIGEDALETSLAVYTDLADTPDPVPSELLVRLQSLGQRCILIVDNCGIELHKKLVARLQKSDAPISVVTVEYDIADETPEHTDVFKLEPASKEIIEKVLAHRYPELTNPEIGTIANFSDGNFRIALALAETSKRGESLANLNDSDLFKRLFRQKNDHDPALFRAAMVCSLVYSFDGETVDGDDAELAVLAGLAGQSIGEFHAHVAELSRRQIIQKRSKWRALLPHAMAHRLAKQALEDLPQKVVAETIVQAKMPDRLRLSFSRRLGFLHDSVEAKGLVGEWLDHGGWLANMGRLNDLGWTLLDNVAPVDPDGALAGLEAAASRDESFFNQSDTRKHRIVRLLRAIAYEAATFDRAINLIIGFSKDGERTNNLGDAVNVFSSLFTIFLSGTLAPPEMRAATITRLARTGNEKETKLAMSALRSMVQTHHFSSSYGFEFGARKRDYGLRPRTGDDYRAWFAAALDACRELDKYPHISAKVRQLVGSNFGPLARMTGMTEELVALATHFKNEGGWAQGWTAARAAKRQLKDSDRTQELAAIEALIDALKPESLADRISAYILPKGWSSLDVADLDFADDEKREKAEKRANEIAEAIGCELASDIALLEKHLPDLAKGENYRLLSVFKAIGDHVEDIFGAWEIVQSVTLSTLGQGQYLPASAVIRGISERDKNAARSILDRALASEEMHPIFVSMQVNAGVSDDGIERLLKAVELESVPIHTFQHLSWCNEWVEGNLNDFASLVSKIANREGGESIAFEIMRGLGWTRRREEQSLTAGEKEIGKQLLRSASFAKSGYGNLGSHRFQELAETCLEEGVDGEVAAAICERIVQGTNNYSIFAHDLVGLVGTLSEKFPIEVLNGLVARAAENSEIPELFDWRLAKLKPTSKMDPDILLAWVAEEPELRSLAAAKVVPVWEKVDGEAQSVGINDDDSGAVRWSKVGLGLLDIAPDKPSVMEIMVDRFSPMSWSGSRATIMEGRLPLFDELVGHEDPDLSRAAKLRFARFKEAVEAERAHEAKQDRERDERFEW